MVMMAMALQVWIPQLRAQATHPSIPCPVLLVSGRPCATASSFPS
jgi:hypothetical protein